MRIRALFLIAALAGAIAAAPAAPLERDLGQGLPYFRVHALPGDLPGPGLSPAHACVLDVRFVQGDARQASILASWIKAHASARSPVILLANRETSADLLAPFSSADSVLGLVIIGPAAPDFSPDIALPISDAADRRAYDALDRGIPVAALINDNPDKVRDDEARLERDHVSDSDALPLPADAGAPTKAPPQIIDAVLQRAVQLHRGLIALKRL